jgi:hypothetical protein
MLICFIDVALLIAGIVFLILLITNGTVPVANNRELRGAPGYIVAVLMMAPLPITVIIACAVGLNAGFNAAQQGNQNPQIDDTTAVLIEVIPLVVCGAAAGIVAGVGSKPKRRKKKKRRLHDEYDDYDDRPVRRKRRDEEEEEEELRSSRRSEPEPEPDEDESPRRRRFEDADDDDAPPRRRRLEEDDDDDFRPRRRRRDDDD